MPLDQYLLYACFVSARQDPGESADSSHLPLTWDKLLSPLHWAEASTRKNCKEHPLSLRTKTSANLVRCSDPRKDEQIQMPVGYWEYMHWDWRATHCICEHNLMMTACKYFWRKGDSESAMTKYHLNIFAFTNISRSSVTINACSDASMIFGIPS